MVNQKKLIFSVLLVVVVVGILFSFYYFRDTQTFTKTSLLRSTVPLGGQFDATVKITNPIGENQSFNVYLNNFEGIAHTDLNGFDLGPKESKEIHIQFKDDLMMTEIYVGKLIIETKSARQEIPVIFGVEDPNYAFAIIQNSIPAYEKVHPGGKFGVDIRIYDLIGANVPTVNADYSIKDFNDEVVLHGEGDLIVGGGGKTELFDIPSDWHGNYVFIMKIDYRDTTSLSSYLFTVSERPRASLNKENIDLFMISVFAFIAIILGFVFYFVKTRDDLLLKLKRQHDYELRTSRSYFTQAKKEVQKSKEKPSQKKKRLKILSTFRKKVENKIKIKHKKQKKQIRNLGKMKKKSLVQRQIDKWKNEGYSVDLLKKQTQKILKGNLDKEFEKFKKQGYDTSFLNK